MLSGSNQPGIAGAVGDSLLGRAAYRTLRPLTLSELRFTEGSSGWNFLFEESVSEVSAVLERRAQESGELDWRAATETGGFPRAVAAPTSARKRLLDDYVKVFANRDIREILSIDSATRFEEFLRLTASRTGQVLNVSGLSNDLGIPVTTVRRWLYALEQSYLVERIPAFSRNSGYRVTKAPKLFVVDAALAMAASREPEPTGFHFETLVASDLAVWKDAAPGRDVHHWRAQAGQEVDFIVESNRKLLPVELKASANVGVNEARHVKTFLSTHQNAVRGLLLSADALIKELGGGIIAAPWWAVL